MKIGFGKVNVNPLYPAIKFPRSKEKLLEVKDELICRLLMIENDSGNLYIHVSFPIADVVLNIRNKIKQRIACALGRDFDFTFTVTHTHYSVNINLDSDYAGYATERIIYEISNIKMKVYKNLSYNFQYRFFDKVGISRISGQESKNIFLETLSFYEDQNRIGTIIIYNSHPTTLNFHENYFSCAGPGLILKEMDSRYPNEFFTYLIGAAGDISTRFTRKGQKYEDVLELTSYVTEEINYQLNNQKEFKKFNGYKFEEKMVDVERELVDLDKFKIPENLSAREIETIEKSKERRKYIDLNNLPKQVLFQRLSIGDHTFIFTPFELFSEYIDYTDKNNSSLINCSNDRDSYVSGLNKQRLTFELFDETVSRGSKIRIKELLQSWSIKG